MREVLGMYRFVLGCTLMLVAGAAIAQPGPLEYAFLVGNDNQEQPGNHIIDSDGNAYTAGNFTGTFDFDPGPGVEERTTFSGNSEGYLAKYDPDGNLLYVNVVHGDGSSIIAGIDFTSKGDVILVGTYTMNSVAPGDELDLDFGPGQILIPGPTSRGLFLIRMSPSGQYLSHVLWPALATGTIGYDRALNVDDSDNVLITGYYQLDGFDMDPGAGAAIAPPTDGAADIDLFTIKLDSNHDFVYGRTVDNASTVYPLDQTLDRNSNLYIVGAADDITDFDPGPGTFNLVTGGVGINEPFLLKLDSGGLFLNAIALADGTTGSDNYTNDVDVDDDGNIYATGRFTGTADFDPTAGTFNLTTPGAGHNMFITKLDSSFNLLWAHRFGSVDDCNGIELFRTQFNSLYIAGWFTGTVDFDPGPGVANLTSGGAAPHDGYVLRLNEDGSYNYAFSLGSDDNSYVGTMHLDEEYRMYYAGRHRGTADFDPGAGTFPLTSSGTTYDLYAAKLGPDPNPPVPAGPYVVRIEPYKLQYYTTPVFRVVFSEPVTGVDGSDFSVTGTTGATIFDTEARGDEHFVAVSMTPAEGEIVRLNLIDDDSIVSVGSGVALGGPGAGNGSFFDGSPLAINYPGISDDPGSLKYAFSIGDAAGNDWAEDLVVDRDGNTYVVGSFDGSVDFDPGAGTTTLTNAGLRDGYVAKYGPTGSLIFAKQFGGADSVLAKRVGLNRYDDSVYISGIFDGTADFDPGPGTQTRTEAGNDDIFLLKLDENGNYLNVTIFGDAGEEDLYDMFIDPYYNIFLAGGYDGVGFDADPGPGVSMFPDSQMRDAFYIRIDGRGDFRGSYHAGSTGDDWISAIVQGRRGEMYLAGVYEEDIDLAPGGPTYLLPGFPGLQGFIVRLSHPGDFLGAGGIHSTNVAITTDIDFWDAGVDPQGNVYLSGLFEGEFDFNTAGGSNFNVVSSGEEGFLLKVDHLLQFGYALNFRPTTAASPRSWGYGVAVDRFGGAWLGGSFRAPTDFDPGAPTLALTPPGGEDGHLLRINADGSLGFAHQLSATLDGQYEKLVFDRLSRNLHGIGGLTGTGDFAVGDSVYNVTSPGNADSFVFKTHFELPEHYLPLPFVDSVVDTGAKAIGTATLQVTFTTEVTGVDVTDFALSGPGTGTITDVTGSGNVYFVTVEYDDQAGQLTLDVVDDDSIVDAFLGLPLGGVGIGNGYYISGTTIVPKDGAPGLSAISAVGLLLLAVLIAFCATVMLRRRKSGGQADA